MTDAHVHVLGPDAAVASFRFHGEALRTNGEVEPVSGAVSLVFERRDGGWKIVHVHESAPEPSEHP